MFIFKAPPCDVIMLDAVNSPGLVTSSSPESLYGGPGKSGTTDTTLVITNDLHSKEQAEIYNMTVTVTNAAEVIVKIYSNGIEVEKIVSI